MKKLLLVLAAICTTPAVAAMDNYVGVRLHQNERISFKYNGALGDHKETGDSTGIGIYVGNRLTKNVRIEFETSVLSTGFDHNNFDFDYRIWSNDINVYLSKNYENVVEPYVGAGVGFSGLWGDIPGDKNSQFNLSYSLMGGVIFALNERVDLNLGLKYHNYGKLSHGGGATTRIDSLEFHIGGAYKFSLN